MTRHLFLLFLYFFILSCKKDVDNSINDEEPTGKVLQRVVVTSSINSAVDTIAFVYNTNGTIKTLRQTSSTGYLDNKDFLFSSDGRLQKVSGLQSPCNTCGSISYSDSFSYRNGRIAEKYNSLGINLSINYIKTNSYTYDLAGRIATDTIFIDNLGTILYTINYSYDNENNLIETRNVGSGQGNIFRYTVSSIKNPFASNETLKYLYNSFLFPQFGRFPSGYLVNNGPDGMNYTYELFSNGMVKSIVIKNVGASSANETRYRFFYK